MNLLILLQLCFSIAAMNSLLYIVEAKDGFQKICSTDEDCGNGTCRTIPELTSSCECSEAYHGKFCDIRQCSDGSYATDCTNHPGNSPADPIKKYFVECDTDNYCVNGKCVERDEGFECVCPTRYFGPHCEYFKTQAHLSECDHEYNQKCMDDQICDTNYYYPICVSINKLEADHCYEKTKRSLNPVICKEKESCLEVFDTRYHYHTCSTPSVQVKTSEAKCIGGCGKGLTCHREEFFAKPFYVMQAFTCMNENIGKLHPESYPTSEPIMKDNTISKNQL